MEELKELVELGMSGRIGRIEIFDPEPDETLPSKLYHGLRNGTIAGDTDARAYLYGRSGKGFKFNMLKKRLKERLYTTILFVQPRQNIPGGYLTNAYFCYKHFVIARILVIINVRQLAMRLMRKTLKRALEFEVYDIAMLAAQALRRDSMDRGDFSKFHSMDALFIRAHKMVIAEAEAERLYHGMIMQFVKSGFVKGWQMEQARKAVEGIKEIKAASESYLINHSYFTTRVIYYELLGDYNHALQIAEEFESYLVNHKTQYTFVRHANCLVFQLDCCLYLNKFDKGQECAEKAISLYREGEGNWFTAHEAYFLLALRTGNLDKAADIYIKVIGQKKINELMSWQKERWQLFSGYLWFLAATVDRDDLLKKIATSAKQFKLNKMLNDIPIFSKDKEGYNITVLILQMAGLIIDGKYLDVISRAESMVNYVYKNLHRDPAHIRSQSFMKMLLTLVKADFELPRVQKRINQYLAILAKTQLRYNASQVYIEVIPYEDLWEMIEQALEKHSTGRKKVA